MMIELREISDSQLVSQKLANYTKQFEILDKLGADNCIDPDDFEEADLEDPMFKNLEIADIEK